MINNKSFFYDLDENFRENVKIGNESSTAFMGKGCVKTLMNKKMKNTGDVFYIVKLKTNFISKWQLQETGYSIVLQNGSWQIHDPKEELVVDIKMSRN